MKIRNISILISYFYQNIYLIQVSVFFIILSMGTLVFLSVDPYDLYSWGKKPKFDYDVYNPEKISRIIHILTKRDYDTYYIGASTSAGFSAKDMGKILPGSSKAVNLSIVGGNIFDLQYIMEKVADAPNTKKVLVQLEFPFSAHVTNNSSKNFENISEALKGEHFKDALKIVDEASVKRAMKIVAGRKTAYKEFAADSPLRFLDWAVAHYRTSFYMNQLPTSIDNNRKYVSRKLEKSCERYPAISYLSQFAQKLEKRGATLDIVFPPYSRIMWFEWVNKDSDFYVTKNKKINVQNIEEIPLDNLLRMRQCTVFALRKYTNTRLFAFDKDDKFVANYANYADPGHLINPEIYRTILQAIASDENRVTEETFPDYEKEMRERTLNYQFLYEPKNEQ